MTDQKSVFHAAGKEAFLYAADMPDRPLILLNEYTGDGGGVVKALRETARCDLSLLVVSGIDWEKELSPWPCPPAFPNDPPFDGGADAFLSGLLNDVFPEAVRMLPAAPSRVFIAGYSLAGLFALYALYRTDRFSGCASCSGSLWYLGFTEFTESHAPLMKPDRVYLSLGDREAKTKHPLMRTVGENTEALFRHFKEQGIRTTFEWNPGNHFRDAELRTAKGIAALAAEN